LRKIKEKGGGPYHLLRKKRRSCIRRIEALCKRENLFDVRGKEGETILKKISFNLICVSRKKEEVPPTHLTRWGGGGGGGSSFRVHQGIQHHGKGEEDLFYMRKGGK